MNQHTIYHDPVKLKASVRIMWILSVVFWVLFWAAKSTIGGYVGAALYGSLFGASVMMTALAIMSLIKVPKKISNPVPIAVLDEEGLHLTDEPYNFGLIRWADIQGFQIRGVGGAANKKNYMIPILKDPQTFLNSLPEKQRKLAKQGIRYGSPAAFTIATASLDPNQFLELLNSYIAN